MKELLLLPCFLFGFNFIASENHYDPRGKPNNPTEFNLVNMPTSSTFKQNHENMAFIDSLSVVQRDSIRSKNIRFIDSYLEKGIKAATTGKNPLVMINNELYTYGDYQKNKFKLKILSLDKVKTITLLKGETAEIISKSANLSSKDGLYVIQLRK